MEVPDFEAAVEDGDVIDKSGYHQPQNRDPTYRCSCNLTTRKGAYRDVSVQHDGLVVHYYHQNPIAVELPDGRVRVSNCGHETRTTKQRLNGYLPTGFNLRQEDYEWILSTPTEGDVSWRNGMVLAEPEDVSVTVTGPA